MNTYTLEAKITFVVEGDSMERCQELLEEAFGEVLPFDLGDDEALIKSCEFEVCPIQNKTQEEK